MPSARLTLNVREPGVLNAVQLVYFLQCPVAEAVKAFTPEVLVLKANNFAKPWASVVDAASKAITSQGWAYSPYHV